MMQWKRMADGYESTCHRFKIKRGDTVAAAWLLFDRNDAENTVFHSRTAKGLKAIAGDILTMEANERQAEQQQEAARLARIEKLNTPTCPPDVPWLEWHNHRHNQSVTMEQIRNANDRNEQHLRIIRRRLSVLRKSALPCDA